MTFGGTNPCFGLLKTHQNGEYGSNFVFDTLFFIDKSGFSQENRCGTPVFRELFLPKQGVSGQVSPGNPIFGGCSEKFFEDLPKSWVPRETCPDTPHFGMSFILKMGVSRELFPRTPFFIGYEPRNMGFQ